MIVNDLVGRICREMLIAKSEVVYRHLLLVY